MGAEIVDPADIPTAEAADGRPSEFDVLLYEFKADLNAYLAARGDPTCRTPGRRDRLQRRARDARRCLTSARSSSSRREAKGPLTEPAYRDALAKNQRLSREEGIDAVMDDAPPGRARRADRRARLAIDLVNGDHVWAAAPRRRRWRATRSSLSRPATRSACRSGISFIGRAWSEPTLIAWPTPSSRPPRCAGHRRFCPRASCRPCHRRPSVLTQRTWRWHGLAGESWRDGIRAISTIAGR